MTSMAVAVLLGLSIIAGPLLRVRAMADSQCMHRDVYFHLLTPYFIVRLSSLLQFIPLPVLYGLFLFMGISSLSGVQVNKKQLIPLSHGPTKCCMR